MSSYWYKKYLPRGLYGRAAMILLVPIVSLQLVVSIVFFQRHYEDVTTQMTANLAVDLNLLLSKIGEAHDKASAQDGARDIARALKLNFVFTNAPEFEGDSVGLIDLSSKALIEALRSNIASEIQVDLRSNFQMVRLFVETRHGVALISVVRSRASPGNPHQFLVITIFFALIMGSIGFIFLRNQVRPIRRLARAADAFGKGRQVEYRPSGAREVRSAGASFLAMRDRIERHIDQRTMMLSGVSHDLRTPLTRLRLALSLQKESEDTRSMLRDVDEMERLLNEFLDFSRVDSAEEQVDISLSSLLGTLADRHIQAGENVTLLTPSPDLQITGREVALGRAIENLIGNAIRYAGDCRISACGAEDEVRVFVEDSGPGIEEEKRDEAVLPFARLDQARNQNSGGGVGLGLAIARDIARRHGGSIALDQSPDLGGLRVTLTLHR